MALGTAGGATAVARGGSMQPEVSLETVWDGELARDAVVNGVVEAGVTVAVLPWGLPCALEFGFSSTVTLEGTVGGVGIEDTDAGLGVGGGFALPVFGELHAMSVAETVRAIQVRVSPDDISPRILTPEIVSDQNGLCLTRTQQPITIRTALKIPDPVTNCRWLINQRCPNGLSRFRIGP